MAQAWNTAARFLYTYPPLWTVRAPVVRRHAQSALRRKLEYVPVFTNGIHRIIFKTKNDSCSSE